MCVMFGAPGPRTALPLSRREIRSFFPLWVSSRGILVVFEAPEPSNVHVWALGLSCETPATSKPPSPLPSGCFCCVAFASFFVILVHFHHFLHVKKFSPFFCMFCSILPASFSFMNAQRSSFIVLFSGGEFFFGLNCFPIFFSCKKNIVLSRRLREYPFEASFFFFCYFHVSSSLSFPFSVSFSFSFSCSLFSLFFLKLCVSFLPISCFDSFLFPFHFVNERMIRVM